MAFLTAKQIHDGHQWLPENSVIEVTETGRIAAVHNGPVAGSVYYDGILAPGFVNVHCHLELSHMKGVVPEHTGLIPFLKTIPKHRNDHTAEEKKTARHEALNEMLQNGIVAVGDIANTTDTTDLRMLDNIHWYTFVESIGFTPANADRSFGYALQSYSTFAEQQPQTHIVNQTIVPHAPYSVSIPLFKLIDNHLPGAPISIHNQESEEENKYFVSKEGAVGDLLHTLGIDDSNFEPTGVSSLQSYLQWMTDRHPFIFVHNTRTNRDDIHFAKARIKHCYWCLCPNANIYIEHRLPDIDMLINEGVTICTGTDSLASNHELSILSELFTIKQNYPDISWETLLQWGTYNGACALQMQDTIGAISAGKVPGIVQITGLDDADNIPVAKWIV